MCAGGARDGGYRRERKANRARRTSRSLGGIGLFCMNFLQLLLQPSRVDDGHRGAWGEGEELAGWLAGWLVGAGGKGGGEGGTVSLGGARGPPTRK